MEASNNDSIERALENARRKAQEILESALGDTSRYTVILKISREDSGTRLIVDIEAYRPRDPWVREVVEEAVEAAVREFERYYKRKGRFKGENK